MLKTNGLLVSHANMFTIKQTLIVKKSKSFETGVTYFIGQKVTGENIRVTGENIRVTLT